MRGWRTFWGDGRLDRSVRRVLPNSFLGRSLLIVLIPLLVTQGIALELFYGNYLHVMSRRMSESVVSEISLSLDFLERYQTRADRAWLTRQVRSRTQLVVEWHQNAKLTKFGSTHVVGPMDEDLVRTLQAFISYPFFVDWLTDEHHVFIMIQLPDGVLKIDAPRKRLDVGQIWLFVFWALGSSLLLFVVAALFMQNQVRAVRRLARAAEQFGLGRDVGPIRPEGAREVRKAAVAFNRMQERISRFVMQRTAVLAGVSHDLRTPLTRLRLSLAMFPQSGVVDAGHLRDDVHDMIGDVAEMERLIESYLSFARGEGAEAPEKLDVAVLLEDVASAIARAGGRVGAVICEPGLAIEARPDAMRRMLNNILENARRLGASVWLSGRQEGHSIIIEVDDNGPGIPLERREEVFRAFSSGKKGGTGLGLTIVRDIVRAHGGDIQLGESLRGGLNVRITLPC
ncbi:ATP-binding protein [Acetobacter sp.]|jgi:two-component system osmolarity sensor histidine kinase EnvZ|uniref:ATP-binding protein n=1 Tax=Acetobacter sp. TaxID=440 RepID=UPI0025BA6EAE|nr:ATP-binding protein [Acetobacter sp.]MCH4091816.1 ATP-binding protein [Acetobacter sp.]MCI1300328.1 ATP-binding protein [Acetobacter sp.]MCI1316854.1 ATP-binding protein [Acetobacter sp.]